MLPIIFTVFLFSFFFEGSLNVKFAEFKIFAALDSGVWIFYSCFWRKYISEYGLFNPLGFHLNTLHEELIELKLSLLGIYQINDFKNYIERIKLT